MRDWSKRDPIWLHDLSQHGLELAGRLEARQVRVSTNVFVTDKDVWDGALARLLPQVILNVGSILLLVELDEVEILGELRDGVLCLLTVRAVGFTENGDSLSNRVSTRCSRSLDHVLQHEVRLTFSAIALSTICFTAAICSGLMVCQHMFRFQKRTQAGRTRTVYC